MVGFEDQFISQLRYAIEIAPEEYCNFVEGQIRNALQSRPGIPFDNSALAWKIYCRTLVTLALDYTGLDVFSGWFEVN